MLPVILPLGVLSLRGGRTTGWQIASVAFGVRLLAVATMGGSASPEPYEYEELASNIPSKGQLSEVGSAGSSEFIRDWSQRNKTPLLILVRNSSKSIIGVFISQLTPIGVLGVTHALGKPSTNISIPFLTTDAPAFTEL